MTVIGQYKYQLHFHCQGCGYAWVTGHHTVLLEEPCPRWFCAGEPGTNYTYERSLPVAAARTSGKTALARKRSIRSAA